MASRFWVGGAGTWDGATTTNWSATSGGAGGASAPSAADDVFFDGSSGTGITTIATGATALTVDCTGFGGTWSQNAMTLTIAGKAQHEAVQQALVQWLRDEDEEIDLLLLAAN